MKIAVMQPYFLPYLGYFHLIHSVDRFVIFDDVNFIKRGWINRNQILVNGKAQLFSMPIKNASQNRHINEHEIAEDTGWRTNLLETIRRAYRRAPEFAKVFPLVESIIQREETNLSAFIVSSLRMMAEFAEIKTCIVESSSAYKNETLKAQGRIIDICKQENATIYVNPPGGRDLYRSDDFSERGIDLRFVQSQFKEYNQGDASFVAGLSIIDVLMWNPKDRVAAMAQEYDLV